jgi:uroporphyrinogen-III decarboxylase
MDNEALYKERYERISKAINLEPVDRVPVVYMGVAFAPRYMGMQIAEFCEDPEAAAQVTLDAMDKLNGLDGANLALAGRITPVLTASWMSRLGVPGRDLPADSLWQVREAEVMTIEDYDTILDKGWGAFFMDYLPRVIDPQEFGESMGWMAQNTARIQAEYRKRGYVIVSNAPISTCIPFEYLCGGRSMTHFFFDLYRIPDKVEAVMQVMMEEFLAQIEAMPPVQGIGGTWLGGWRAASALVAPKLWDRFVWPYYLKLAEALIAKGVTPVLHWDQDWTRDLERLRELPAKKCILNPDGMTDMKKFIEMAGDRMAMMGDIPASLLAAGTPDDVYTYVREQIEMFEGTGLILCPGCDAPINAKPENMEAFVAAAHEYGKVAV